MDSLRFCVTWPPCQATGPEGVPESWGSQPLTSDSCGSLKKCEFIREAKGNLNWWWASMLGLEHLWLGSGWSRGSSGQREESRSMHNISDCIVPERDSQSALVSDKAPVPTIGSLWYLYVFLWLLPLYLYLRQVKWITLSTIQQSLNQNIPMFNEWQLAHHTFKNSIFHYF